MTDDELDRMLRAARDDAVPLGEPLRARVLADAAAPAVPVPRRRRDELRGWLGALVGVPAAAALGLWIGIARPDAVLPYLPTGEASPVEETALLDDVFGAAWIEGETG